ncbi:MAG: competence/damage-inducible protein A [Rhodospirillaceae bacterium]|nr:competence/damage-inducible protein A [Rhodospirillaceae bacterium]|tara:strand:- start:3323 stop:4102 length:780 start_codon:yes stop_codon:yes gene_type:complete
MNSNLSATNIVTSAFVIIGNEILSGRTKDVNLAYLAKELVITGIRLEEVRVIQDDRHVIADTIRVLRKKYDYIFTSGGIGPTHDDITCESVAQSFGLEVEYHPDALERMKVHAKERGVQLNEARLRMARTPVGATLILNPVSAAPGFTVENVHVMAGVPAVFQAMVNELLPTLRAGTRIHSKTVVCNLGEGTVARGLEEIQKNHPTIDIGSYPFFRDGIYGTSLVLRGPSIVALETVAEAIRHLIKNHGGNPVDEEDQG